MRSERRGAVVLFFAATAAFAQLPPLDSTPPTVAITSPASGSTISGTIDVTASASDNVGIAGVQFYYDGIPLGAEDMVAPYATTAHTASVPDGTYTLTAVARDAAGNRTNSSPVTVTVNNSSPPPPPPPSASLRYEETDPSVSFSSGWVQDGGWFAWSGGGAKESMLAGAQATFNFTGTSVTWIGVRGPDSGIARVSIDGALVGEVDQFARSYEARVPVFSAHGLSEGSHSLTIEVTGLKNLDPQAASSPNAFVVVDAFDVPAPVVSRLQETDPGVTLGAGWFGGDASRSWSAWNAAVSTIPGAQATLNFNGTAVSWIGYRGPDAGIARVYIDGNFAGEVDLYNPDPRVQAEVFGLAQLADGNHSITIESTGLKNGASSAARVVIDAFEVSTPGKRFEQTHPSVVYSGDWTHGNLNRAWSMGSAAVANAAGAQATFTFSGTSVSWISTRKSTTGIARVYLDGVFVTEIDTYWPSDGLQDTVFTATGLANTSHTLAIEATGRANPSSSGSYVVVDAFDVRP